MRRLPVILLIGVLVSVSACATSTPSAVSTVSEPKVSLTDAEMENITGNPLPPDDLDPLAQTKSSILQNTTTQAEGPMRPSGPAPPGMQQQPFPFLQR